MVVSIPQQESITIDFGDNTEDSFKVFNQMRKNGILCDITLVAKTVEIPAHRSILASGSPYFYNLLTDEKTQKQDRIEFDVNPELFASVIDFLYTSTLTVSEENIKGLLEIAKMLSLKAVQEECCKILRQIIHPNNCLGIKTMAITYGDSELATIILSYIDTNFAEIIASEEFLSVTNDQLSELITRDTLMVLSEEKVYECIIKWINHDQEQRQKYIKSLIEHIRLPFISKEYLKQNVIEDPIVKADTYCEELINNALLEEDTTTPKVKPRQYYGNSKILLAIGGWKDDAWKGLEYYDFEKGTWSEVLEMPIGISSAALATVNQKVYVIGGIRNYVCTSAVSHYDISTNSWHEINPMTVNRGGHGAVVLNNCIYAIGGWNGVHVLNSAEKFDPETQTWNNIAAMFNRRQYPGVAVLNDILYVIGGSDGSGPLKLMECYNPNTNSWKKLCSMNEFRSGAGACALDGKIYAIGGYNWMQELTTAEVYDPDTDSWTEVAPMTVARSWAGVTVVNKRIYVVGGKNSNLLNSVEVYDPAANFWTMLPKPMNVPRSSHAVVIAEKPA